MIANLERQEVELNDEIAQLEADIENGAGDVSELRCRIAFLEFQLESTGQKLADKRDKLKLADRQLAELQNELDALSEKRDNAQKNFHEFTEKNQEQVRMRLTDAVFARMVVDVRSLLDAMPSELKADIDGDFLTAIQRDFEVCHVSVPRLSRWRNPIRPVMRWRWQRLIAPVGPQER